MIKRRHKVKVQAADKKKKINKYTFLPYAFSELNRQFLSHSLATFHSSLSANPHTGFL